jgi:hypothetical protein
MKLVFSKRLLRLNNFIVWTYIMLYNGARIGQGFFNDALFAISFVFVLILFAIVQEDYIHADD